MFDETYGINNNNNNNNNNNDNVFIITTLKKAWKECSNKRGDGWAYGEDRHLEGLFKHLVYGWEDMKPKLVSKPRWKEMTWPEQRKNIEAFYGHKNTKKTFEMPKDLEKFLKESSPLQQINPKKYSADINTYLQHNQMMWLMNMTAKCNEDLRKPKEEDEKEKKAADKRYALRLKREKKEEEEAFIFHRDKLLHDALALRTLRNQSKTIFPEGTVITEDNRYRELAWFLGGHGIENEAYHPEEAKENSLKRRIEKLKRDMRWLESAFGKVKIKRTINEIFNSTREIINETEQYIEHEEDRYNTAYRRLHRHRHRHPVREQPQDEQPQDEQPQDGQGKRKRRTRRKRKRRKRRKTKKKRTRRRKRTKKRRRRKR